MRKSIRGQLLLESFVAISVAVVSLLGILALLSSSLGYNRFVADRYIANNLAAEGIEIIKNIIDTNFVNGVQFNAGLGDGDYEVVYNDSGNRGSLIIGAYQSPGLALLLDPVTKRYHYDAGGQPTSFRRQITISNVAQSNDAFDELAVISRVEWTGRGGAKFDVIVEDHFFNWR